MSCGLQDNRPDWKAYVLAEMTSAERRQAEGHASGCAACRDEIAQVRLTLDALSTLREEEIPRRIAFVSDKVFEPKWWQQGPWQALFHPTFAAACVLALAILVHAFAQPGSGDPVLMQAQVDAAVAKAVANIEVRHSQQAEETVAAFDLMQKQVRQMYIQTSGIVRQ